MTPKERIKLGIINQRYGIRIERRAKARGPKFMEVLYKLTQNQLAYWCSKHLL